MNNKISKEDKDKFVEFLNFIAENAKFKYKTDGTIQHFKLLSYMQNQLMPKIVAQSELPDAPPLPQETKVEENKPKTVRKPRARKSESK